MNLSSKFFGVVSLVTALLLSTGLAHGEEMQFALEWAPVGTFATGSASGTAVIDTAVLQGQSFFNAPIAGTGFVDLEISVSGSGGGDGTFSIANGDIDLLIWQTAGPIDFSTELFGQANLLDFNVGFPSPTGGPEGFGPFIFSASNGALFELTSFSPVAIPEPTSAAVYAILVTAVAFRRRR